MSSKTNQTSRGFGTISDENPNVPSDSRQGDRVFCAVIKTSDEANGSAGNDGAHDNRGRSDNVDFRRAHKYLDGTHKLLDDFQRERDGLRARNRASEETIRELRAELLERENRTLRVQELEEANREAEAYSKKVKEMYNELLAAYNDFEAANDRLAVANGELTKRCDRRLTEIRRLEAGDSPRVQRSEKKIQELEADKVIDAELIQGRGNQIVRLRGELQAQSVRVHEYEADKLRDTQTIAELGSTIEDLRERDYERQLRMKEFETDRLNDSATIEAGVEKHAQAVKMYEDFRKEVKQLECQRYTDQQMIIDQEGVIMRRGTINRYWDTEGELRRTITDLEMDKRNDSETIMRACEANEQLNDLYEDYQRYIAQLEAEKLSDARIVREHRERHERDIEHQNKLAQKFEEWRNDHDNELASVQKLRRDKEAAEEKHRALQARYEKIAHELEEIKKKKEDPGKRRGSRA